MPSIENVDPPEPCRAVPRSGLSALVAVARGFGMHLSAEDLARANGLAPAEVTVAQLLRCAASAGLKARALTVDWAALDRLGKALPAIVPLTNGAFLLLHRVETADGVARAVLADPAAGDGTAFTLDRPEFERVWLRQAVLLRRNYGTADADRPFGARLIASMVAGEGRVLRDVAISAGALALLALAPVLFWNLLTDRVLEYRALSTFSVLCASLVVLIAFEAAFSALRRFLLVGLTIRVDARISTWVFDRVLGLPVDYFERTPAGDTLHRMYQIGRIRNFMLGQLFGTVLDGAVLVVFVPVMLAFSPLMTAVVLGFCALICLVIVCAMPRLRRAMSAVEAAEVARGSFLSQAIHGVRTVKSLALDARQRHLWDVHTARIAEARAAHGHFSNAVQTAVLPLERLAVSSGLAVGVYVVVSTNDVHGVGSLFAFLMLSQRIAAPLIQISQLIQQFDEARIAVDAIGQLVNQAPEQGRDGSGVRKPLLGRVEFQGVTFRYRGAVRPALRDLTFEVPQGTTLGVMGRSGSGKTTITRLLQRLHSDYSGLIKIDGVDVRQYDVDHLRASLGVVLQENFLFSGTIRDNIAIAKPDATYDDVVTAARMAGAEEFIDKLPAGYDTWVYEGSPNLSGGQRQRLAIARALITDPKILILDEATSALDAESEAIVNANIDRIARGRTVITISHRLSALVKADAIMVLDGGAIDDIGRHEELLERNDIYAGLWHTQNQHAAPAQARPARPQLAFSGPLP